jgi:hypothetical protein
VLLAVIVNVLLDKAKNNSKDVDNRLHNVKSVIEI